MVLFTVCRLLLDFCWVGFYVSFDCFVCLVCVAAFEC